jgi:hypothetical protein
MVDGDECGAVGGKRIRKGKPKNSGRTCRSATLSDLGSNLASRDGKPAINRRFRLLRPESKMKFGPCLIEDRGFKA